MNLLILPMGIHQIYLLPCTAGYLQIDTGYAYEYPDYRRKLARAGVSIEQVRHVFLTHAHDDHAGFLSELVRDASPQVIAHRHAAEGLRAGTNDKSRGGGYINRRTAWVAGIKARLDRRWTLTFPPYEVRPQDILLDGDDDSLMGSLGVPGRVLHTPGHTRESISLLLDGGETFCGDAAANFPAILGTRHATIFMTDMEEAYRSWQKLLDSGCRRLYPAHGAPFSADCLENDMGRWRSADLVKFF